MEELVQNKVTKKQIDDILDKAEFHIEHRIFGKQCIIVASLENGFTIVGESACVEASNYEETIGVELAMERIRERLWELEGYRLQCRLHEMTK